MEAVLVLVLLFAAVNIPGSQPASYRNCRMMGAKDSLLYHRRIKQDPTRKFALQFASFPEPLIDFEDTRGVTVISCIICKDLRRQPGQLSGSACRVVAGGVGHSFVRIAIVGRRERGYDFDIKIFGHRKGAVLKEPRD